MISYDVFAGSFLGKITEYDFIHLDPSNTEGIIDDLLRKSSYKFGRSCGYDFSKRDDVGRFFDVDIPEEDLDEIVDIISEGMVVEWLKPYVYRSENLMNVLNTKDFTSYSPAELLLRITGIYREAKRDFRHMTNRYSYEVGDLTDLHL